LLIRKKDSQNINDKLNKLITTWKESNLPDTEDIIFQIKKLLKEPYEIKIQNFNKLTIEAIEEAKVLLEQNVNIFIEKVKITTFITFDKEKINQILAKLEGSKKSSLITITEVLSTLELETQNDEVKIGSRYAGGIVFYLDDKGNGLVVAEKNFEKAIWGVFNSSSKAIEMGIGKGSGMKNTKNIVETSSTVIQSHILPWKSKRISIPTAARLCIELNHNGYSDWYLPTIDELKIFYQNLIKLDYLNFEKDIYWSSNKCQIADIEESPNYAHLFNFQDDEQNLSFRKDTKKIDLPFKFFAVREF
jgi:hypothetical protein